MPKRTAKKVKTSQKNPQISKDLRVEEPLLDLPPETPEEAKLDTPLPDPLREESDTPSMPKPTRKIHAMSGRVQYVAMIILAIVLLVGLIEGGMYFYMQVNKHQSANQVSYSDIQQLTEKVGRLVQIPNETPTVATVTDTSRLTGQAFFAKAENGDKVLIFPQSRKAILYRPRTDKIIEVSSVTIAPSISPTVPISSIPSISPKQK